MLTLTPEEDIMVAAKRSARTRAIKDQARKRWDKLTHDDLDAVERGVDAVAGKVADRYGMALDEARTQVADFMSSMSEMASSAYDRAAAGASDLDDLITDSPWRAVIGATVLGIVVGYAMGAASRPRRRRKW